MLVQDTIFKTCDSNFIKHYTDNQTYMIAIIDLQLFFIL